MISVSLSISLFLSLSLSIYIYTYSRCRRRRSRTSSRPARMSAAKTPTRRSERDKWGQHYVIRRFLSTYGLAFRCLALIISVFLVLGFLPWLGFSTYCAVVFELVVKTYLTLVTNGVTANFISFDRGTFEYSR